MFFSCNEGKQSFKEVPTKSTGGADTIKLKNEVNISKS